MRSNEFCPSVAIMVADCEKLCTKYTVDFFDRTSIGTRIGTRDLSEGREEELFPPVTLVTPPTGHFQPSHPLVLFSMLRE